MEQILDQMESDGPREEVQALRVQLEQLLPTQQEEELSGQIQALFRIKRPGTHNAIHSVWFHPVPRTG